MMRISTTASYTSNMLTVAHKAHILLPVLLKSSRLSESLFQDSGGQHALRHEFAKILPRRAPVPYVAVQTVASGH